MIDSLKPYPKYRDSGVPWLGEVPEHWEVVRFKRLFREIDDRSTTGTEALLSLRMEHGLVDHHESGGKTIEAAELVGYKRTTLGDVVMNRMRAAAGLFAATPKAGIVSPDYAVLRPRTTLDRDYFVRLFRTPNMMAVFRRESRGLGTGESGFLRLYTDTFGEIAGAYPPLAEQHSIARFLTFFDNRISRYIRARKKLIALLEEQKQAIIHRAVTRGLDPNVQMKPSGVEWLGNVPEHWEVASLRRKCAVTDCKHLTVPFTHTGFPLASVREVQGFELSLRKAKQTSKEWYDLLTAGGRSPRKGDIIYCRNVGVGASAIVSSDEAFAMGQDVCLIRCFSQNPRYLNFYLHSPAMQRQLNLLLVGSTFDRINVAEVKALVAPFPPPQEQAEIAHFLDAAVAVHEKALQYLSNAIDLARESRSRLLADTVTGKLDVREVAACLPKDAEADEISRNGRHWRESGDESEAQIEEVEVEE